MSLYEDSYTATKELITYAKLTKGDILVVGCSTSEVFGEKIGKASKPEIADEVFRGIWTAAKEREVFLAAQCCEHLNRAIIIERELAKREKLEIVNVVPQPKAGGSFATKAYENFKDPVVIEHIKANAGMDIGDTLIGMHLREVAVPVRLSVDAIGNAHLVCARTRAKFIGGQRAFYDDTMM